MSLEAFIRMHLSSFITLTVVLIVIAVIAILIFKNWDRYAERRWTVITAVALSALIIFFYCVYIARSASVNSIPRSKIDRSLQQEQINDFNERNK